MRKTTTFSLVVAASAVFGTVRIHADDAAPDSTTRGTILLPVGDKVHGFLRGGETHALRVHLAKGDVYSFSVDSRKRGDPLTMHLTFLDPSGREINADARVLHAADGKKIAVGPFKATESGTYVMELSAQGWHAGDYWGSSSVRGSRRTVVRVPSSGTIDVNVGAGSTIRVRSGALKEFVVGTPGGLANRLSGTDALVASLRGKGLASGETGVYSFGAPGSRSAVVEVTKPAWKAALVDVPTLPDDPTRLARFDFALNGWKRTAPVAPQDDASVATAALRASGAPVAVAASASDASPATSLFVATDIDAMTAVADFALPPAAPPPFVAPPTPAVPIVPPPSARPAPPSSPRLPNFEGTIGDAAPASSAAGTPMDVRGAGAFPTSQGRNLIGATAFLTRPEWRDVPWTIRMNEYPAATADAILPRTPPATSIGPALESDVRYFVDGHEVPTLLATGGDASVEWRYAGTIELGGATWAIEGEWRLGLRAATSFGSIQIQPRSVCSLSGTERATGARSRESIALHDFTFNPTAARCDPVGHIENVLTVADAGLKQTVVHAYEPLVHGAFWEKRVRTVTTTIDSSTAPEGATTERTFWSVFRVD